MTGWRGHPIRMRFASQVAVTSADRVPHDLNLAATRTRGTLDGAAGEAEERAQAISAFGLAIELHHVIRCTQAGCQGHGLLTSRIDSESGFGRSVDDGLEVDGLFGPELYRDRCSRHHGN